jgi:endonuclease G, mitochondrial
MTLRLLKFVFIAIGFVVSNAALADGGAKPLSHCAQFVPFGFPQPTVEVDSTPLCRIAYFTLHDNARKVPLYSAEYLLPENVDGEAPRKNNFRPDPQLDKHQRSENVDYARSGYDRGHLAPAENFRRNSVVMSQSFYLSNMVPHEPGLNRGLWRMLEFYVVTRVRNGERLYVITGPIFEGETTTIGPNKVAVPSSLFKVIFNKDTNTVESYIIPNVDDPRGSYPDYRVGLNAVNERARLNLTPNIMVQITK